MQVSWRIRKSQRGERPTFPVTHKKLKMEFVLWWKRVEFINMTKKEEAEHMWRPKNASWRKGGKKKCTALKYWWLSLLTTRYKTAHGPKTASQAPWQHQASDWTPTVRSGIVSDSASRRVLVHGWLSWIELKRKTTIIQVFQEAVQHFFFFFWFHFISRALNYRVPTSKNKSNVLIEL